LHFGKGHPPVGIKSISNKFPMAMSNLMYFPDKKPEEKSDGAKTEGFFHYPS